MSALSLANIRNSLLCISIALSAPFVTASAEKQEESITSIAIDQVWSGHRIKPYLLTRGEEQFVGYFDANRQMTVAHRTGKGTWRYYKVDSWLGWDSHNYITMELDAEGHLHVMGNMHADPIEYFRTTEPLTVRSLKRIPLMVDKTVEQKMTYPIFMLNKNNELLFKYRDGGSGNGNEIYNIYNTNVKSWSRLHANQFLDGEGKMSGYFEGPTKGPDGYFHLIWVWRNTPSADTNHSLSYARSVDLVHWEDSSGKELPLPLTLKDTEVVDPVAAGGGMINGNVKLGFDQHHQPIISYHKYDEKGNTQMFVTRREASGWNSVQISQWEDFRWDFTGHGSLGRFAVKPYSPKVIDKNTLGIMVRKKDEVMRFVLDTKTLKTLRIEPANLYPPIIEAKTKASNVRMFDNNNLALEHHVFAGEGQSASGSKFYLSWHTQPGNRDRAHSKISQPSVLLLTEIKE